MKCILFNQITSIPSYSALSIQKLEITVPPNKTTYLSGETFDKTGMVIIGTYGVSDVIFETTTANVTDIVNISPEILIDGVTEVEFSIVTPEGKKVVVTQPVTVKSKVVSLQVDTTTLAAEYEYGDSISSSLSAIATYSDGSSKIVTATTNQGTFTAVGQMQVIYSYTENSTTVSDTLTIDIQRKRVAKPVWKNITLTYNGNEQNVNNTTYWDNYNTDYWVIENYTGQNAGNYIASFSLKANYRWDDQTIDMLEVEWSIAKAAGSLSLSTSSVSITASGLTQTVTITRAGNGTISYSPISVNGLTLSLSGNVLTIKGNGSTAVSNQIIIISVAEDNNYTAPASKTVSVSATYWEWGSETVAGDATWWAGLKSALPDMTATERANLVGKKKKITLTAAVAGWNSGANVSVIAVAADTDADNSLTFQTEGCSPDAVAFGSVLWAQSTAKTTVESFANNCSATASMLSVTKLTSSACNNNKNNAADVETTAKGFLPSEVEMGIAFQYSSSHLEGTKGRTIKAYSYYNSNTKRVKYQCSANGDITISTSWYWERSRAYSTYVSNFACCVNNNGAASDAIFNDKCHLAPAFVI